MEAAAGVWKSEAALHSHRTSGFRKRFEGQNQKRKDVSYVRETTIMAVHAHCYHKRLASIDIHSRLLGLAFLAANKHQPDTDLVDHDGVLFLQSEVQVGKTITGLRSWGRTPAEQTWIEPFHLVELLER